jgi:hypothetical protein
LTGSSLDSFGNFLDIQPPFNVPIKSVVLFVRHRTEGPQLEAEDFGTDLNGAAAPDF